MKSTYRRRRNSPARLNRVQLEALERREMLTSLVADDYRYFLPSNTNAFSVRADTVATTLKPNNYQQSVLNSRLLQMSSIDEVSQPEHGTVAINEDGLTFDFLADGDHVGLDSFEFEYTLSNGDTGSSTAWLNLIEPVYAVDDWAHQSGDEIVIDVLENDLRFFRENARANVDVDGIQDDVLSVVSLSESAAGALILISDDGESISYRAPENYTGVDSFTYRMDDAFGASSTATVHVEVNSSTSANSFGSAEEFDHYILELLLERNANRFGKPEPNYHGDVFFNYTLADGAVALDSTGIAQTARLSTETSGTNLQVDGVDEGDLIKTDGDFLYMLSNRLDDAMQIHELVVMDVSNQDNPFVVKRLSFDGELYEQYLDGDRLTVISNTATQQTNYDSNFLPFGNSYADTMVSIFDVSDPTAPQLLEESRIDSGYVQSRAIGDTVHLVTSTNLFPSVTLETTCADTELNLGCFYETAAEFASRIRNESTNSLLPRVVATAVDGISTSEPIANYQNILKTDVDSYGNLTSILSFNIDGQTPGPESTTSVVTKGIAEVFVSTEAIYLLEQSYGNADNFTSVIDIDLPSSSYATIIKKFEFDAYGGGVNFAATGVVPGYLLNRFSVDEYNGNLRITTTSTSWSGESSLFVLQQSDNALQIIGAVEHMAPGERIYAARFMGDRAYIVTFRKVDPLFVIDLSDPTSPEVLGELKIPGYSSYLQMIDEHHLIGIGRNADENSGLFQGLQVSLFNVEDASDPILVDRYTFEGGRNTYSPIAPSAWNMGDHHAVTVLNEYGLLALPIYSEGWWSGNFAGVDNTPIFADPDLSAIRLLSIDPENGIEMVSQIEFAERATRSVRIGDYLYAISPDTVKVVHLQSPDVVVAERFVGIGATDDHIATRTQGPITIDLLKNDSLQGADGETTIRLSNPPNVGQITVSNDGRSVTYAPPNDDFFGKVSFSYQINATGLRETANVDLLYQWDWHNQNTETDVNGDGRENANDLLVLVNLLNDEMIGEVEDLELSDSQYSPVGKHYPDVNGDGRVNQVDAIRIVNRINRNHLQFAAEGEASGAGFKSAIAKTDSAPIEQAQNQVGTQPMLDPDAVDRSLDQLLLESSQDDESLADPLDLQALV